MLSATDHNVHLTQGMYVACHLRAIHVNPAPRQAHDT